MDAGTNLELKHKECERVGRMKFLNNLFLTQSAHVCGGLGV